MIDISEAVFLGVAVYADEQLVYVVFPGTELRDGAGGNLGYRIVIAAQQNNCLLYTSRCV